MAKNGKIWLKKAENDEKRNAKPQLDHNVET
jgi:hypothetical protein